MGEKTSFTLRLTPDERRAIDELVIEHNQHNPAITPTNWIKWAIQQQIAKERNEGKR